MSESALFSTYARYPITLVKGKGSRLWDDQGKEYLDFMSGLAVTNLGHVPDTVKQALVKQLDELWHISNLFSNPNGERAARLLVDNSCADAVFFCNSGADANEAAIKLARRYHQKVRGEYRYEIITFNQSFHGRTLATLTATGQDKVKEGFLPLPEGFVHVPLHDVPALESAINDRTAAIMLELVQAEGGVIPVEADFLRAVRELCDKHGLLLIIDEVQTGMGRTGKLFAYQHYDVEPDVFTLAKGIGSGFPVGAMLAKKPYTEGFVPGSHATTFGGTPIAMSVVVATIETMLKENVAEKAAEAAQYLMGELHKHLDGIPGVAGIRGKGLLVGILCDEPAGDAIAELHKRGLLVVPAGPNVIRLLPNLLVTHEEIDEAVGLIAAVLTERAAAKQA
ncbi:acetylornithine transaminase [Cohnella candidum]|uniref:Acetylornithine aminotransferase n=1 Tax=Cohnella candidum TaxID=2674991 RepID=A0A3G3K1S8_9BACL|nr:acetylornithine transaminase [Cohnella candidum]AYQ74121.1 acetylornithine transaminase [Cohnella candidum]